ncbi:MAG: C_GCAxxG_C_C family protein [Lachnospiraceae bacterium]|nr:C_GCAxxG_C_C family protein [Lachnospiraceae bacterium]
MNIDELLENSERAKKGMANFKEGYNCTQAVVLAFADLFDMDTSTLLKLACSFGGGMGRLREVCGTVSGMFMVAGLLYGYDDPKDFNAKSTQYARIQELAARFIEINGSIVCRELLGLTEKKSEPVPEKRTEEYYKKRPCEKLVGIATAIMEEYINETTAGLS